MEINVNDIFTIQFLHEIENTQNDNIDIIITLANNQKYHATIFTLENINEIMLKHQASGESSNGIYFGASNMLILKDLSKEVIIESISDLIKEDDLEIIFHKIN